MSFFFFLLCKINENCNRKETRQKTERRKRVYNKCKKSIQEIC